MEKLFRKMNGKLKDDLTDDGHFLNHEKFEQVLKISENKKSIEKVLKFRKLSVGNGQLHNMGSDTYKQVVSILKKDGKVYEESFIVKELPRHPAIRSHIMKERIFEKEVLLYSEIFPLMEKMITNAGLNMETIWPECISCDPAQYLILEDLSRYGYKVHTIDKLMDFEHSLLGCTALAKLHALSIILVEKGLLDIMPILQNTYTGQLKETRTKVMKTHFSSLYKLFSQWGVEWKNLGKQLVDKEEEIINKYRDICQPNSTSLNVLNHSDMWLGNIMFKYCEVTGRPKSIKLIDYQLSCFASYGLDLQYFLRVSVSGDILKKHYHQLLAVYYDTILNIFKQFNFKPIKPFPTFEQMQIEIESKKLFPIFVFLYISPRLYEQTRNAKTMEPVFNDIKIIEQLIDIDEHQARLRDFFEPYLGCDLLSL